MSKRELVDRQKQPEPNDSRPIWDLVIEDMRERDRVGRKRYGTPLQAHNGLDAMVDAYQEALDLVAYLRQVIEERSDLHKQLERALADAKAKDEGWNECEDDLERERAETVKQSHRAFAAEEELSKLKKHATRINERLREERDASIACARQHMNERYQAVRKTSEQCAQICDEIHDQQPEILGRGPTDDWCCATNACSARIREKFSRVGAPEEMINDGQQF